MTYVYESKYWPHFRYDLESLSHALGLVRNKQGKLLGYMSSLGFTMQEEAILDTATLDVLKSSEIEGVFINPDQVRSSVARRLGIEVAGLIPSDRNVEGVVGMMLDATQNFNEPLTKERLFGWHLALFPMGKSGMYDIVVGKWRDDNTGPMQVVSGAMGRERVHFQAPDASKLEYEMETFLDWFNNADTLDPVLKSALAHFWFVTIHPFDDGNGRIARALADMQLARADGTSQRFYSLSAQIRIQRKGYYEILELSSRGSLDITEWLQWYLDCLLSALVASDETLKNVLSKAQFWQKHAQAPLNERQRLMLNKLFDDLFGSLNSSKWAKMNKCSPDTALRDIQDLINKGMLLKDEAGGRSTNYRLKLS
ncbi:MAG: Fic family protein [Cytophagales bacterium]